MDQDDIEIRTHSSRRCMVSAQSFIKGGLYSSGSDKWVLNENQTNTALPEMKIDEELLSFIQDDLKQVPVPYNIRLASVITYDSDFDTLTPKTSCKYLRDYKGPSSVDL